MKNWTRVIICVFLFVFLVSKYSYAEATFAFEESQGVTSLNTSQEIFIETSKLSGDKWTLPYVTAHSAILMDVTTGDVLYERDAYKRLPIASTTKILTAILALEMAELDEIATISEKADKVGESTLYLNRGEKIKLEELIEGALIRSGNDACVAIGEQVAGSIDEFVRLMNLKAISLGAVQSNFVNTNGLPDKDHYSTAYDLAVIARYAMNNSVFSKIVAQKVSTINYEIPQKSQIVNNTNKLLWNYSLADGIKTGTTNAAGKCLVASASKDGRRLICVLLNAPDRFGDAQRLLEWGFNHTEIRSMGNKDDFITNYLGTGIKIPLILERDVTLCIEKTKIEDIKIQFEFVPGIYPPVKAGEVLGNYNILVGNKVLKRVPLVTKEGYGGSPVNFSGTLNLVVDNILDLFDKKG